MYYITNRKLCDEEQYFESISKALDVGIKVIIREKDLSDEDLKKLYFKILNNLKVSKEDNLFIINSNENVFNYLRSKKAEVDFINSRKLEVDIINSRKTEVDFINSRKSEVDIINSRKSEMDIINSKNFTAQSEKTEQSIRKYNEKELGLLEIKKNTNYFAPNGLHLSFAAFKERVKDKHFANKSSNNNSNFANNSSNNNLNFASHSSKILGISLHSISEVEELACIIKKYKVKVDYITLSHIFETKCKEGLKPKGIELLKTAREIIEKTESLKDIKIVALGGIKPENIEKVMKYSDDFAVMSSINLFLEK
jgi:thiamine monophosphate synthase